MIYLQQSSFEWIVLIACEKLSVGLTVTYFIIIIIIDIIIISKAENEMIAHKCIQ